MDNTTNVFNQAGQHDWAVLRPDQQEKIRVLRQLEKSDLKALAEDYKTKKEQYIASKIQEIAKRQTFPEMTYEMDGGAVQKAPLNTYQIADLAEIEVKRDYQVRQEAIKEKFRKNERTYLSFFENARDITLPRPGRDI